MKTNRRQLLAGLFAGALANPVATKAHAAEVKHSHTLRNGLRLHFAPNRSGYVSAALVLQSQFVDDPRGLAHIMEHTSFTGAAGSMTAGQVKSLHETCIQDSNASTGRGKICWSASFLPRNTAAVMRLLATTSLDQKFDVQTVASEARIVLQELYLDKYDAEGQAKKRYNSALFGRLHPYGRDSTDKEIATARLPAPILAEELTKFASLLKLPANMDLFMVGDFEPTDMSLLAEDAFGRFDFAKGPALNLPRIEATSSYIPMHATSKEFTRPLSENRIAWSTGVRITDPEAPTLFLLSEYLNKILFKELREKSGDAYTPQANFTADACSGVFELRVQSSNDPKSVERRIFSALANLKATADEKELQRFVDKVVLQRLKIAQSNDDVLACMQERVLCGASSHDFKIQTVTREDIESAARRFVPAYEGGYVRLSMAGQ